MVDSQDLTGAGYALVDGNNFFVSCERVFSPRLIGRPVVVLSNNDGCVVSRSNEAKAVGIPMAAPWFKCRRIAEQNGVVALSGNFELYGDMSERLMRLLEPFAPVQEIYSIDECFLDWSALPPAEALRLAPVLRKTILRSLGLPCGLGVGATKTLAKLANATAKKNPAFVRDGFCVLNALTESDRESLLGRFPVEDLWGIGRRTAPVLGGMGIRYAADLRDTSRDLLRSRGGVIWTRIADELAGIDCLAVDPEAVNEPRQSVLCSRSFGTPIKDLESLVPAVAGFASRAAGTLRGDGAVASGLMAFAYTDRHREDAPQYRISETIPFAEPLDDTREIVSAAVAAIRAGFREGYAYKKAGVVLFGISPSAGRQLSLFGNPEKVARSALLMEAMDRINRTTVGAGGLRVASEMGRELSSGKSDHRSRRATTSWAELVEVKAG